MHCCTKCKMDLPPTAFYRGSRGALMPHCKECHQAMVMRRYRERMADPHERERVQRLKAAAAARYHARNPDRSRLRYASNPAYRQKQKDRAKQQYRRRKEAQRSSG